VKRAISLFHTRPDHIPKIRERFQALPSALDLLDPFPPVVQRFIDPAQQGGLIGGGRGGRLDHFRVVVRQHQVFQPAVPMLSGRDYGH